MDQDALIAIVGTIAVFSIPVVAILTAHQRKMAEIIHGSHNRQQQQVGNEALASEMRELKQAVYQQSIAMDTLRNEVRQLAASQGSATLSDRLSQEQRTT